MLDLWCGWAGDNGTLMQVLWMQFLRPELCCAQQRAAECKWQDALACLLALQLFLDASDDTWLTQFPVSDLDQLRCVLMRTPVLEFSLSCKRGVLDIAVCSY